MLNDCTLTEGTVGTSTVLLIILTHTLNDCILTVGTVGTSTVLIDHPNTHRDAI